jgi:polysaccharide biosynthesis transport protein
MKELRSMGLSDYINILWRRRWYVLTGFVLVSGAAAVYGWRTPNVYKSSATLSVETAVIPEDYVRSSAATVEEQVSAIRQLVQSRSFMKIVADNNNLSEDAIKKLGSSTQVASTSKNTIVVSCTAATPEIAQVMTTNVVNALRQEGIKSRRDKALETDLFLQEQLRETEKNLKAQEEKIAEFKTKALGSLPEQSAANVSVLNGLDSQRASAENAIQNAKNQLKLLDFRAQEQKRLNALARSISVPALKSSSPGKDARTVPANPQLAAKMSELRTLTSKYTANHPDVVRVSREVEELKRQSEALSSPDPNSLAQNDNNSGAAQPGAPAFGADMELDVEAAQLKLETESIKNEIAKREKEKESILGQIYDYRERLKNAPAREQVYAGLARENDALREQYRSLQGKKFQSQLTYTLANDNKGESYNIIDVADYPTKPAFPDRVQIILIGLVGGLAVGVGAAFGRELLDSTISSEEEVAAVLKLPALVTISEIPAKQQYRRIGPGKVAKSA